MIPITSCVHGDANGDLDVVVSGFTWLLRSGGVAPRGDVLSAGTRRIVLWFLHAR